MRILLVLLMVSLFGVHAAVLPGAILSTTDTSGTNARPSRITVSPASAGTNLMVGSLAVTNNLNVGANAAIIGSLGVTSSITNTALTPSTLVYSTATRVLGSLTLGNSGDVFTSAGAGVAPTFQPFPSFTTIWTNDNGTISATSTSTSNLVAVTSGGSNAFQITYSGGIRSGLGFDPNWSFVIEDSAGFHAGSVYSIDHQGVTDLTLQSWAVPPTSQLDRTNRTTVDIGAEADGFFAAFADVEYLDSAGKRTWIDMYVDETISAFLQIMVTNGIVMNLEPTAPDGTTPFFFRPTVTHTSGQLLTLTNGTYGFDVSATGRLGLRDGSVNYAANIEPGDAYLGHMSYGGGVNTNYIVLDWGGGDFNEVAMAIFGDADYLYWVRPQAPDGTTPYVNNTSIAHSSGNLFSYGNLTTDKITGTWDGVVNAVGGFGSTATDTAVTIAATGWTNTFGKNAVVYLDGTALVYAVYNNAGTPVYTNSVGLAGSSVLLQPAGKVIIRSGVLGVGRATPF